MARLLVTITPPTPNGDLHIGHIAGPFLAADVYARVQRQRGHDCTLVSYSDDYQSYMLRKGIELGRDHQEIAHENSTKIQATLKKIGIGIDHWLLAQDNPYFRAAVQETYDAAAQAGAIASRDSQEPYCAHCDKWGYEAFGRGLCNHCGVDSDASQCEGCAHTPDAAKMQEFRCKLCARPMHWQPVRREFLQLAQFRPLFQSLFGNGAARASMSQFLREEFEMGFPDWGITRPHDGGLDLREDGSRRIHTWVMGLSGYFAAFREFLHEKKQAPHEYDEYCKSGQGRLVHFLGYDCAFSHMIVYPALLQCMKSYRMEQSFYTNQFLTLNGKNLSTSRNHAIWARDLVDQSCADSARLYLASVAPEEGEGDFDVARFEAWRREVFADIGGKLAAAAAAECAAGAPLQADGEDAAVINALAARWLEATSLEHFSMRALARLALDVVQTARERLAAGAGVLPFVALAGAIAAPLAPGLSARLLASCQASEAEAIGQLLLGNAPEYVI
ncbi:methionine--tRNA ligase [Massilia sp. erpn]|uniref:methionine--tRNA ligase n=1 Tax=Massilia sp. erpn TaxID=2738142 RepID=UPI002106BE81|nr:methionine--tRNA ligase [Massilia sp. erpn]UTY58944.1 methionine--tRNA ligase [Massilia sp. erpn]